ncbi:MAG: YccF domain-containing protein [Anaerolineales bacterium]|nr:MAG: YccF domain-containing protein [Anaerolineales bacterium]
MSILGNLIWLVFGGLLAGLGYILGGLLLCLSIVGIPFGLQSIKLGVATFAPFGKEVVEGEHANSPLRVIFNIIWLVFFGWEIAVAHLVSALVLAITIIGIPFAKQHVKLVPLALFPFGRDLR